MIHIHFLQFCNLLWTNYFKPNQKSSRNESIQTVQVKITKQRICFVIIKKHMTPSGKLMQQKLCWNSYVRQNRQYINTEVYTQPKQKHTRIFKKHRYKQYKLNKHSNLIENIHVPIFEFSLLVFLRNNQTTLFLRV